MGRPRALLASRARALRWGTAERGALPATGSGAGRSPGLRWVQGAGLARDAACCGALWSARLAVPPAGLAELGSAPGCTWGCFSLRCTVLCK